jgi:hypothetical protein
MRRVRKLISALALAVLVAAPVAAGVTVWLRRLPDPAVADEGSLGRWLVTRDLAAQTPAIRARLLRRVEHELRRGPNLAALHARLTVEQRQVFWRNVETLAWDWFREQAAAYARLPPGEEAAFVDRQLDLVSAWPLPRPDQGPDAAGNQGLQTLFAALQKRIDGTPPAERERMRQFVLAVQARLFLRTLRSGVSGPPQG